MLKRFCLQQPNCPYQYRKRDLSQSMTHFFLWEVGVTISLEISTRAEHWIVGLRMPRYTSSSWMRRQRQQWRRNSKAMEAWEYTIHRLLITDPGRNYPRRHGRPAIQGGEDRSTFKKYFSLSLDWMIQQFLIYFIFFIPWNFFFYILMGSGLSSLDKKSGFFFRGLQAMLSKGHDCESGCLR